MWSVNGKDHRYGVFFICKILEDDSKIKLSEEHADFKWFDYNELMKHYSEFKVESSSGNKDCREVT
jgi:8-oxo-dGTP pyrophosphatase MutT (NUDIX family)